MAKIQGSADERVFQIKNWLGMNENPDGDTKLTLGEAAVMRNFKITRDGNLQRRPGSDMVKGLLQTYTLEEDAEGSVVRRDDSIPGQLTMYPTAEAGEDGFVVLSGDPVVVSYDNNGQYAGYYWRYNYYNVYRLVSCQQNEAGEYLWTMKRVRAVSSSANQKVAGLWSGNVKGQPCMVAACDGKLWKVHDGADFCKEAIGEIETENEVFFFGYSEKLYILNGKTYKEWDGTTIRDVEGYRPVISVAVPPTGGGTLLEQVNKLNGLRRARFSPDGEAAVFTLPEHGIKAIDYVKDLTTGEEMASDGYTADLKKGTVTFTAAPAKGVSSLEIAWSVEMTFRDTVNAMRFAEIFNGANDNRVFLYGDGSNKAFYSGLDYDGNPRADYFPDMNELVIGEANTPITAMIRHYSRLIVFKTNSTYSVQYGIMNTAEGATIPAYYATPVNRTIGNVAPGQVRLVLNSPYSLHGRDLYEWKNNSSYSANLTVDERQAKRISDRITATLDRFNLEDCYCFDSNDTQEYFICWGGQVLVHNYAVDAWYYYDNLPVSCMVNFQGELYYGDTKGRLNHFSYRYRTDNGEIIRSYWESGSLAFEQDFMRKYSSMLWVGIKPEEHGEVWVTVQTDRKSVYANKVVASSLMTFSNADFRRWSFNVNRKPHMARLKIKAKKFVFYKLIFSTESINTTTTILSADLRVRYTGYAR